MLNFISGFCQISNQSFARSEELYKDKALKKIIIYLGPFFAIISKGRSLVSLKIAFAKFGRQFWEVQFGKWNSVNFRLHYSIVV